MDYSRLFIAFQEENNLHQSDDMKYADTHIVGDLIVSSGKIIACDPYYCGSHNPFSDTILPPGKYPVVAFTTHFTNGDERIALTALVFQDRLPVNWGPAIPPGESANYGYCVDSGVGSFMDADTARIFASLCEDFDEQYDEQADPITNQWETRQSWVNANLDEQTGANIIAFYSGWGDGCYGSYFGYDEQKQPVCLLTNFDVLNDEE